MKGGEWFVAAFVTLIFGFGIYGGIKLWKFNKKERAEIAERNKQRNKND